MKCKKRKLWPACNLSDNRLIRMLGGHKKLAIVANDSIMGRCFHKFIFLHVPSAERREKPVMKICAICGKMPIVGRRIKRRGLPKRTGGIGLKTTGISRRRFLPNLQFVRAVIKGSVRRIRVCASCIQAGKVQKPFSQEKQKIVASSK